MIETLAPARSAAPKLQPLRPEQPADAAQVSALIERAFGPGRYVKAAERLRERNTPLLNISMVAEAGDRIVGCVRMWPISIGETPAVFLGPFAVDPTFRSAGLGAALIRKACAAAKAAGHKLILLVGDGAYFEPLGFRKAPRGRIVMPGPVDPDRVFVMALAPAADESVVGSARQG